MEYGRHSRRHHLQALDGHVKFIDNHHQPSQRQLAASFPKHRQLRQADPAENQQQVAANDEEHRDKESVKELMLPEHHFRPLPPSVILVLSSPRDES